MFMFVSMFNLCVILIKTYRAFFAHVYVFQDNKNDFEGVCSIVYFVLAALGELL